MASRLAELESHVLEPGISRRVIRQVNGLDIRILEAGLDNDPCLLLLHGFPELAFSWRKLMLPLAAAGYHVVAPDQRGYGMTSGADTRYDGDVASFRLLNLARDALGLVYALGRDHVDAVIGHDFGSPVAGCCALIRPDVFRAVALMSAPFAGMPSLRTAATAGNSGVATINHQALAALARPREHYQWYYSGREANDNMRHCEQGVHNFLRAYYHTKSADWPDNKPFPLADWSASSLARMPTYYVMDKGVGMADTVAVHMPDQQQIDRCRWLTEAELSVYSQTFEMTGFQGGLNWYRCVTSGQHIAEMQMFSDLPVRVPAIYIAGASDWGIYQKPGELEQMRDRLCTDFRGVELIAGAGHWVQQEQPAAVVDLLLGKLLAG